jgi:hypothetical protein
MKYLENIGLFLVASAVIMLAIGIGWNWSISEIFGLPRLGFSEAIGLTFLYFLFLISVVVLFSSFREICSRDQRPINIYNNTFASEKPLENKDYLEVGED